jgi:hypothetical protein
MDAGVRCYGEELLAVLSAATAALNDLPARIPRLTGADLDAVLPVIDGLAAVAGAGRFTVTAEAVDRGRSRPRRPGRRRRGSPTGARRWMPGRRAGGEGGPGAGGRVGAVAGRRTASPEQTHVLHIRQSEFACAYRIRTGGRTGQ